ncbi:MAG: cobalamin biosynthesis protein CobD [Deltaproteobacteria bacterium]|nr:cobalamin biosynthesis protein CobD [Deltaproteobacteria bacterium]
MPLELILICALLIDLLLGDPRQLPHPVSWIGWLAKTTEKISRQIISSQYLSGLLCVISTLTICIGVSLGLLFIAGRLHPLAGDAVSVLMIYICICPKDLSKHANSVFRALKAGNIPKARKRVGMIVGRETSQLDEPGIVRAAVESVAESIVDGATAPLFYAAFFGPVGAIAYRAINTMDSMFGYKNESYFKFGFAAARLDDLANYIPARLTAPIIGLVSIPLKLNAFNSWRIMQRDCKNHSSPNSGFAEAAMAGALGVQLGGDSIYFGKTISKPTIGEAGCPLHKDQIQQSVNVMFLTVAAFAIFTTGILLGMRWFLTLF